MRPGILLLVAAVRDAPMGDVPAVEVSRSSPWMEPARPVQRLRTTCLINCYNYQDYVIEAVRSALNQTHTFDEIIVVDDGSTDGSPDRVTSEFEGEPSVAVLRKSNEGQLSCFHRGFAASSGDLIFFLDADDRYERTYAEKMCEIYRTRADSHFAISAYYTFGNEGREVRLFSKDRALGYSAVLALTRSLVKLWVSPTSTLSMRRSVLERFLPLPHVEDWRSRADDCLLFGSALVGASKYYSASPLVGYRVHRDNQWYGRVFDEAYEARREAATQRLFAALVSSLGLEGLEGHAAGEFGRLEDPRMRQLWWYGRIAARSSQSPWRRVSMLASMVRGYLWARARGVNPS